MAFIYAQKFILIMTRKVYRPQISRREPYEIFTLIGKIHFSRYYIHIPYYYIVIAFMSLYCYYIQTHSLECVASVCAHIFNLSSRRVSVCCLYWCICAIAAHGCVCVVYTGASVQ